MSKRSERAAKLQSAAMNLGLAIDARQLHGDAMAADKRSEEASK